ncbi:MAG TPA: class I SAM-dependent methyltransferase [Trebonia sp.]
MIARVLTSLRLRTADARDAVTGRRDRLIPPRRLSGYVGGGDFRATGEEFLTHFRQLAGLRPEDRVLEVGCGIGRMSRVLAGVLRPPGSYDGFDVVAAGIAWCQSRYRQTPAPFRFQHADLRNPAYNPGGTVAATDYRFPYGDGAFDLVIATSLFTHLLADAADHYLAETARVLAPGGRMFCTWYLIEDELRAAPPGGFHRVAARAPTAVRDPDVPEDAVAFDEAWVRERLNAHGLSLRALARGSWSGGAGSSLQDIVIADRR